MAVLRIARLSWDDWNLEHIKKYHVSPAEAEQAVRTASGFRESYKGRLLLVGMTEQNRALTVIIGPDPELDGVYYVFSARDASRKDRAWYKEQEGGSG